MSSLKIAVEKLPPSHRSGLEIAVKCCCFICLSVCYFVKGNVCRKFALCFSSSLLLSRTQTHAPQSLKCIDVLRNHFCVTPQSLQQSVETGSSRTPVFSEVCRKWAGACICVLGTDWAKAPEKTYTEMARAANNQPVTAVDGLGESWPVRQALPLIPNPRV